jgi:hypothetical protein
MTDAALNTAREFCQARLTKSGRGTADDYAALDTILINLAEQHAPATVRQLYYRAVVAGIADKSQTGYDLIQRRLLKLRRDGSLSYHAIVDNTRTSYGRQRFKSLDEFAEHVSKGLYAYDYWRDTDETVAVWCESDSIASTLTSTVCHELALDLNVARGFSSETYLWQAAQDLNHDGRPCHLKILSDFDPSGVSLAEHIADTLANFTPYVASVERVALNREQVEQWQLPTHPIKQRDKRARAFMVEHGDAACELEAIAPDDLHNLVYNAVLQHISEDKLRAARRVEQLEREAIASLPSWLRGDKR